MKVSRRLTFNVSRLYEYFITLVAGLL